MPACKFPNHYDWSKKLGEGEVGGTHRTLRLAFIRSSSKYLSFRCVHVSGIEEGGSKTPSSRGRGSGSTRSLGTKRAVEVEARGWSGFTKLAEVDLSRVCGARGGGKGVGARNAEVLRDKAVVSGLLDILGGMVVIVSPSETSALAVFI